MWKRSLEVLVLLLAVGGLAAVYQAPSQPSAPAPSPPLRTAPSTAPARPGPPPNRWGTIPCQVLLEQGHLRLRFKNDGPEDFNILTGGSGYHLTIVSPERIQIQADYYGCALTSIHDCYHTQSLLVPAGKSVMLDLGRAPQELAGLPDSLPGEYVTYPRPANLQPKMVPVY
ncbi:MAG: hypothetical protein AB7S38_34205 [Vulcanimicrobiota bacterium]